jgi:hypothetical protein
MKIIFIYSNKDKDNIIMGGCVAIVKKPDTNGAPKPTSTTSGKSKEEVS